MERGLLRAIMNPAMVVVWATACWLMARGLLLRGWLHVKLRWRW